MPRFFSLISFLLLLFYSSAGLAGKAEVGRQAPWFKLKSVTGKVITNQQLRGYPSILVVGRSQKAAPLCKDWIYQILGVYGKKAHVYQVIVTNNPWFIPNHVVIKKIKKMIEKKHLHRVLIEWHTVFADAYGVAKGDLPTVFVLDPKGVITWRYQGILNAQAFASLRAVINAVKKAQ